MGSFGLVRACRGQLPAPVFFEQLGCEANAVLQGKGAGTKNPKRLTQMDRIVGCHTLYAGGVDVEATRYFVRPHIILKNKEAFRPIHLRNSLASQRMRI
jgi:hypothetical protein